MGEAVKGSDWGASNTVTSIFVSKPVPLSSYHFGIVELMLSTWIRPCLAKLGSLGTVTLSDIICIYSFCRQAEPKYRGRYLVNFLLGHQVLS